MRRLLLLSLFVIMLLTACSGTVPPPHPGELLYITTFDAFNEDWQQYAGQMAAQVTNNGGQGATMQITIDAVEEGAFTLLDREFSDFDLIVDTTLVTGPVNNGFGVLFRHQDNRNYYLFMISSDGYYQVSRRLNGVDEELSDWVISPAIRQGQAMNTIRVVGRGNTFTFFVNDTQLPLCLRNQGIWNPAVPGECLGADRTPIPPVLELVDDAFPQGRIGLGARSFDESGVVIAFDNLIVCGPQPITPIPFHCAEQIFDQG